MLFDVMGPPLRRRLGKSFRKRLGVFNYKVGNKTHKKPGVIPLHVKQKLLDEDTGRARAMIKLLERDSPYPFGKFTRKSKFIFDPSRVPVYNVPDLTGFDLRPYVSVHTPKVDEDTLEKIRKLNDWRDPANFNRTVLEVPSLQEKEVSEKK